MTSIIYVGMDVHTTNYTLCCYSMEDDRFFAEAQVEPDAKNILKYLARIEKQQSRDCRIVCGYEAGCHCRRLPAVCDCAAVCVLSWTGAERMLQW